jgi:hypothetical protein
MTVNSWAKSVVCTDKRCSILRIRIERRPEFNSRNQNIFNHENNLCLIHRMHRDHADRDFKNAEDNDYFLTWPKETFTRSLVIRSWLTPFSHPQLPQGLTAILLHGWETLLKKAHAIHSHFTYIPTRQSFNLSQNKNPRMFHDKKWPANATSTSEAIGQRTSSKKRRK